MGELMTPTPAERAARLALARRVLEAVVNDEDSPLLLTDPRELKDLIIEDVTRAHDGHGPRVRDDAIARVRIVFDRLDDLERHAFAFTQELVKCAVVAHAFEPYKSMYLERFCRHCAKTREHPIHGGA